MDNPDRARHPAGHARSEITHDSPTTQRTNLDLEGILTVSYATAHPGAQPEDGLRGHSTGIHLLKSQNSRQEQPEVLTV